MKRNKGPKCKCGCGLITTWSVCKKRFCLFIPGHYFKLNGHSEEAKLKQSKAKIGKKLTEEHKRKISIGGTGLKRSEETKRKISEALKRHQYDPERIKRWREHAYDRTGMKWSEEVKKKISESNKGKHNHYNENNPNWKNGVSFLPYPPEWKEQLKNKIKTRDDYICQNPACCGKSSTLTVHHIDYVKSNCSEFNLITLCYVCNSTANSNRELWKEFYNSLIKEKYNV